MLCIVTVHVLFFDSGTREMKFESHCSNL